VYVPFQIRGVGSVSDTGCTVGSPILGDRTEYSGGATGATKPSTTLPMYQSQKGLTVLYSTSPTSETREEKRRKGETQEETKGFEPVHDLK